MVRLSPRSFRVLDDGARPVASPGDHVGLVLREARLASGRDLGGIAADLRIRHTYLAAIEDGRFDILPGPTYAVGFVRSYAEYLGLRPDLLVDRFKSESSGVSTRQALDFPTPMPEGRFPGGAMLAVAAVFVSAIFGGWYYLDQHGRLTYPRVPQLPAAIASVPPRLAAPFVAVVPPRAEPPAAAVASPPATAMAVPVETGRVVTEAPPARDPAASIVVPPSPPEAVAAGEEDEPEMAGAQPADTIPPEAAEAEEDGTAVAAAVPASAEPAFATPAAPISVPQAAPASVPAPAAPVAVATPVPAPAARQLPELPVTDPAATGPAGPGPASPPVPSQQAAPIQQAALPEPPQAPGPVGDAGRVLGRVNQDARIVLNATADSWVQVRDGEQNVLFTQMLRAGDSYRVPNRDGLVLLTGNAGGLVVAVDGDPVPMLGPEGAVLRNVRLDAGALKTGTATR